MNKKLGKLIFKKDFLVILFAAALFLLISSVIFGVKNNLFIAIRSQEILMMNLGVFCVCFCFALALMTISILHGKKLKIIARSYFLILLLIISGSFLYLDAVMTLNASKFLDIHILYYYLVCGFHCFIYFYLAMDALRGNSLIYLILGLVQLLLFCALFIWDQFQIQRIWLLLHVIIFITLICLLIGFGVAIKEAIKSKIITIKVVAFAFVLLFFATGSYVILQSDGQVGWNLLKVLLPTIFIFAGIQQIIAVTVYESYFYTEESLKNMVSNSILENYNALQIGYTSLRKINHDLRNHYQSIYALYQNGEHQRALDYLRDLQGSVVDANPLFYTGNILIDSVLNAKLAAHKDCLSLNKNIPIPANLDIDDKDLCSILVNVLDNAIESISRSNQKKIGLNIFFDGISLFIICKNSHNGVFIKKEATFLSTKVDGKNHGFGLKIITDLADKYGGIFMAEYDEEFFIASVSMPAFRDARNKFS